MPTGRYAPSPTGPLHVGNLRTALAAWLFARSSGSTFRLRIEDLDPVASRPELAEGQLADLRALGLDWDGAVVNQSERSELYAAALDRLDTAGLLYPCFCTRREIQEATRAPHHGDLPAHAYPGTCRTLSAEARADRAAGLAAGGRAPALRVRAAGAAVTVTDRLAGTVTATLDDFVVRRADGVAAYQLAVVVDDATQGIGEVVRGDDLLDSTPRQVWLADTLGLASPSWTHVPLVHGPDGERLAKRHGAVTLHDLRATGWSPPDLLSAMAASLGLASRGEPVTVQMILDRFDPAALPHDPWVFSA